MCGLINALHKSAQRRAGPQFDEPRETLRQQIAHRIFPQHRGRDLLHQSRGDIRRAPCGCAVTLEITGTVGAQIVIFASSACNFGCALAISGE